MHKHLEMLLALGCDVQTWSEMLWHEELVMFLFLEWSAIFCCCVYFCKKRTLFQQCYTVRDSLNIGSVVKYGFKYLPISICELMRVMFK